MQRTGKPQTARLLRAAGFALAALLVCVAGADALDEGESAPSFSAPLLDGKGSLALDGYRGKVVYLDFWASWCPPCLVSLPILEQLRQEFSESQFQVIAVNVDREPARARSFLAKRKIGYPSATDPDGRIPEKFGIETMPTSFLIDRQGIVRHVHRGFRKGDVDGLRDEIRQLLNAGGR